MKASTTLSAQARIFLTYAAADRRFAAEVADALELLGAKVSSFDSMANGDQYNDAIRRAIRESDAVVVPLGRLSAPDDLPANVIFEIGAAAGAGRAIYVVSRDVSTRLPFDVPHLNILPMNRIDEIVRKAELRELE